MVTIETNHEQVTKKGIVATVGRWMPIHNGHKKFLIKLAKEYSKIIILIGSAYENGTEKNCIPATEREKMIRAILKREEIPEEKYEIVPIEDTRNFEKWILLVKKVCMERGVTHFCTGNQEDILNVLEKRGEDLGFEMINPEEESNFPYHATDIRKMIIEGKYEELEALIPDEIKPILFRNTFKEIIAASQKRGIEMVPGRQTVDVVLLIRNTIDGKVYVLVGNRSMKKVDFPGYLALPGGGIDQFETPIHAAIRELEEEAGLEVEMLDNSLEPAIVRVKNVPKSNLEQMFIVGIYSSEEEGLAGSQGGSSQCFGIFIQDDLYKYQDYIKAGDDLENVKFCEVQEAIGKGLAFQQEEMLRKAINICDAYPDLIKPIKPLKEKADTKTLVISFVGASGAGKSTAALGTTYELKKKGLSTEYVQEFPKELVYQGILGKYIPNQSYIIAEQYRRIYDLVGQVDFVVTDAGLQITALHSVKESKVVEDLAWYLKNKVNQVTIFIERDEENVPFETKGRVENEAESREFGEKLEKYLQKNNDQYIKVKGTEEAIKAALKAIETYQNK